MLKRERSFKDAIGRTGASVRIRTKAKTATWSRISRRLRTV